MNRIIKSVLSLVLGVVLVSSSFSVSTMNVDAAGNDIATATTISIGTSYSGNITEDNTKDVYKFTIDSSGRININLKAYISDTHYWLYDSEGVQVWGETYQSWNDVTQVYSLNTDIDLTKGTYYFAIERASGAGSYNFIIEFTTASESFTETLSGNNQEVRDADDISVDKTYNGQLAVNDSKDIYKFTIDSSGRININLKAYVQRTHYYIYDSEGVEVWGATWQDWNDITKVYSLNTDIDLTKGTYYFAIEESRGTGNYNFIIKFTTASESFTETLSGNNQELRDADNISVGETYRGQLALNDDKDIYKFTLSSSRKIKIYSTAQVYRTRYYIYDSNGNSVWESGSQYWDDTTQVSLLDTNIDLTEGTYYFAVEGVSGTGNYTFTISCAHQYSNKCDSYCNFCNAKRTVKPHNYKTTTTKATTKKNGAIVKKCTECGVVASKSTINYAKTFKLSAVTYTYNGKAKTPGVVVKDSAGKVLEKNTDYTVSYASGRKKIGTYKVIIKMKGKYSGTKTLTFKINPVKTTVSKLTAGKKNLKVSIAKKTTQITGYQIQYSTSKKFANAKTKTISNYKTTKYTLQGLQSKKTYYVRVRTYKTVGKTKYYSGWSAYKYKKVK